jgi:Ca-activated chloride channel family protein
MRIATLCACAFAVWYAAPGAQQPTFSVSVDVVRLDVLVTDRGRVVRQLGAADFEVLDNKVPQQIDAVAVEQVPLRVTLAFDLSGSVTGERLDHLRSAGSALLDGLRAEDQAQLLTFSETVARRQAATSDVALLRTALDSLQPAGDTALYDGTFAATTLGESPDGRNLVLMFSDGVDTASWLSADQALTSARRANVVVYSAVVRGAPSLGFLRDVARQTGGDVIEVESSRDLRGRFEAILQEFRQRYLLSYTPRGIERRGWHDVAVRVKSRTATVRARPGYQVD